MLTLLRKNVNTVVITNVMIDKALANDKIADLEDALQYACAETVNADYIITRDKEGYSKMSIETVTAEQLMALLV